ncbi:MAG TPA: pitrilysin family protein [Gammaproteobacteria bacterium]
MSASAHERSGAPGAPRVDVLLPVPAEPTVSFSISFRVGSQDDPPGKEGLAYLTGLMLAEAATENRSFDEILEALYPLASGYAVRVDKETTTLTGRTHRDNLDRYVPLLTDAYLKPAFAARDFERLRSDAVNDIENTLRYAQDEELAKAALHAFVFEGTPYAHPPEGTAAGLRNVTLDDVRALYRRRFTAANVTIGLAGGFDDALVRRMAETKAELPPGAPATPPVVSPRPVDRFEVLLIDKPGADASISFGYPLGVRRGERDFYALAVANSWLGEHRNQSSHLFQVIREMRGLNYGDYSYIEAFPEGGERTMPPVNVPRRHQLFEVWIRTLPNEHAHFALRAALRELERLVTRGMTREEFDLTRAFLSKYVRHFAETTSRRLGYAMDDRFYGLEGEGHLERFVRTMDELTVDDVNMAVARHLRADRAKIAIVTGAADALAKALADGAPSPIRYATPKPPDVLGEDREIERHPLPIAADAIRVMPVEEAFAR